ncbi:MAG: Rossman fold protein, TIGR00730 family [Betaproteobacteria bacterium RIFCSPLOWO2_02_FULL_65_24]|nr:MAG: Rossman fold protein, TIGR00730 family [Betaproteobacteria bacterium RIFCSPLOWO2_02_FULL_65_24]
MAALNSVCIFCGSSPGHHPAYRAAAESLGRLLAERGIQLVYGGGKVGLMGALAESMMAAGGEVIGVIPQGLLAREKGHRGITRLEVVTTMHERKARMAELADGFIALPGGLGTLEEFCEILTWSQLGIHGKPVALYNVSRFFDPLLDLFDHAVKEGFLRPEHRQLVLVADEVEELLQAMHDYRPATVEQWEVADATKLGT